MQPELCLWSRPILLDVASPNTAEFVHYSKDKIICKILAFLWTEHENTGFVPSFEQKIQGLSRTPFNAKKALGTFLFQLFHNEQFYPDGVSVFGPFGTWESGLDKASTEIQGLSSTDCNFQGLSKTFKVRANPENKKMFACCFPLSSLVVYCLSYNLNVLFLHDSTQCYKQRTTLFQP